MANNNLIFIVAAFALGAVMIFMRERIPPQLRRGMAIVSVALILFAFFLIVYSLLTAGT